MFVLARAMGSGCQVVHTHHRRQPLRWLFGPFLGPCWRNGHHPLGQTAKSPSDQHQQRLAQKDNITHESRSTTAPPEEPTSLPGRSEDILHKADGTGQGPGVAGLLAGALPSASEGAYQSRGNACSSTQPSPASHWQPCRQAKWGSPTKQNAEGHVTLHHPKRVQLRPVYAPSESAKEIRPEEQPLAESAAPSRAFTPHRQSANAFQSSLTLPPWRVPSNDDSSDASISDQELDGAHDFIKIHDRATEVR